MPQEAAMYGRPFLHLFTMQNTVRICRVYFPRAGGILMYIINRQKPKQAEAQTGGGPPMDDTASMGVRAWGITAKSKSAESIHLPCPF